MDLLSERNRALLESFLEADTRSILQGEEVTPWNQKYRKLGEAIATVLDDYSLVGFFFQLLARKFICTYYLVVMKGTSCCYKRALGYPHGIESS